MRSIASYTEFPFSLGPIELTSCVIAIFCAFLIGLERQIKGKPAGIRTSILVCLGAYTFVAISGTFDTEASPSRVIGQVVTGVGFLGAGLILSKNGWVHGVTSASIIWILAAIGCLIGIGSLEAAVFLTLTTLLVLVGVNFIERAFKRLTKGIHRIKEDPE